MTSTQHVQQQWNPQYFEHYESAANSGAHQLPAGRPASAFGDQNYPASAFPVQQYTTDAAMRPDSVTGRDSGRGSFGRGIRHLDQGRFWVGAVLTAVVAALAAAIGMVVAQDLLRVPISLGSIGLPSATIGTYSLMVAVVAMLAAVAFNGMMAFAPRPGVYYGSLTGLLTALAVLMPFTATAPLTSTLALAGINLVVGVLIMALVPVAASNARSRS